MSQIPEAIIGKINALLNKTVENGCSVEESATAAKIAQQLLTQYRLTFADISINTEKIHNTADPLYSGQRSIVWKDALANVLCQVNGCKGYTQKYFGQSSYRIIGRDSDIEIVRYMFLYLTSEIEHLCKVYMSRGYGSGKTWSNNFKLGAVSAICERLREAKKEVIEANDCRAIVKLSIKDDELQKWTEENMKFKKAPVRYYRPDNSGYNEGRNVGKRINLNSSKRLPAK